MAQKNLWDDWCMRKLKRRDTLTGAAITIEPGAAYFVNALEQLGGRAEYSCEGHPKGFYVCFRGPYRLALKVAAAGFLTVELARDGRWSISLRGNEQSYELGGAAFSRKVKNSMLRMAVDAWERDLFRRAPNA